MAAEAPARSRQVGGHSLAFWLRIVATVLFVLASFAGGGHALADISFDTWFAAGFAAMALSFAI